MYKWIIWNDIYIRSLRICWAFQIIAVNWMEIKIGALFDTIWLMTAMKTLTVLFRCPLDTWIVQRKRPIEFRKVNAIHINMKYIYIKKQKCWMYILVWPGFTNKLKSTENRPSRRYEKCIIRTRWKLVWGDTAYTVLNWFDGNDVFWMKFSTAVLLQQNAWWTNMKICWWSQLAFSMFAHQYKCRA